MRTSLVTAVTLTSVLCIGSSSLAANRVLPPFDPDAARQVMGRQTPSGPCTDPPPPAVDMGGLQSRYDPKDPTQSKVDPERDRRDKERSASVEKFTTEIDRLADRYATSQPPNQQIAACMMHKVAVWARAEALTRNVDQNDRLGRHQAIMTQAWHGAGLASALVRAGGLEAAPGPDADAVRDWMRRLALNVKAEYTPPFTWLIPANNHKYWSGYFLGIAAALLNDPTLFKSARSILDDAIDDIGPDGSIAKEMSRGPRAQSYQFFATMPIVGLAVQAERNGVPLSTKQYEALDRLLTFNVDAHQNPGLAETKARAKQEPTNRSFDFAWVDMIMPSLKKRNPDLAARLDAVVSAPRMRPAWHIFLGGDVTATYNPPALSRSPSAQ
ncbi:alginate lyase family protein [Methylobacterium sp. ID0610]|uniref:alginate lyase family protein n=1 Tax=Methylobacterium carpenticola TaxID=3344827 RepID=UPI0036770312